MGFLTKTVLFFQVGFLISIGILYTESVVEVLGLSLLFWLGWFARQLTLPQDVEVVGDDDDES